MLEERLATAMREVNTAVAGIYILFVEPYLRIEARTEGIWIHHSREPGFATQKKTIGIRNIYR